MGADDEPEEKDKKGTIPWLTLGVAAVAATGAFLYGRSLGRAKGKLEGRTWMENAFHPDCEDRVEEARNVAYIQGNVNAYEREKHKALGPERAAALAREKVLAIDWTPNDYDGPFMPPLPPMSGGPSVFSRGRPRVRDRLTTEGVPR